MERASFEDVWEKITKSPLLTSFGDICGIGGTCTGSTISDLVFTKDAFKKYWDNRFKTHLADAYYSRGVLLFNEKRTEEAIDHYKIAIKIKPGNAKAHYNLGVLLFNAKRTEEAIGHYKTAIKIKPDYAIAQRNLKEALLR